MAEAISHDEMIIAEEALIADAQFIIHNLMEDTGISRADLARKLGVSQARVAQMFSDTAKNLTLRTIARIFRALGQECQITCDRWETLRRQHSDGGRSGKPPLPRKPAASDFAILIETGEELETFAEAAYAPVSNDNLRVNALAA